MNDIRRPIDEFHRLRALAAQGGVQAICSQIALGFTLCRIALTELEYGHVDKAQEVTRKLRKLIATASRHLNEKGHVPTNETDKVRDELTQLEERVLSVEERLRRKC